MNPLSAGLRQPDPRSCGAATVVMARLVRDGVVLDQREFGVEVQALHHNLTSTRVAGRWQLPWPRALGTPPWAVGHELGRLTGVPHRTHLVRWTGAGAYDALVATGGALYVGNGWLPRHVVLCLPGEPLRCYEPASGRVVVLDRGRFADTGLDLAGWQVPWFTVAPVGRG